MEKGRILTGARARFLVNGEKVGYARSVSITEEMTLDPVEVLNNIQVEEYVPTSYRVTMNASHFRIVGETIKSMGWFPASHSNPDTHLENILTNGALSAILEDAKTNTIIATLEQVKATSHNYTVDARGIVAEDMAFVAILAKDESDS